MAEKITFGELIDLLSGETSRSKEFTHDFLKDFVSVIHSGLEEDGKVNIAGLGKFELREMAERQGYNPQTGEKMTIPAHYKVDFKPYKDLRELVNAPYDHLEPVLLEEEDQKKENSKESEETAEAETTSSDSDSIETSSAEKPSQKGSEDSDVFDFFEEQEFIPTGPPTSLEFEDSEPEASSESSPDSQERDHDQSQQTESTDYYPPGWEPESEQNQADSQNEMAEEQEDIIAFDELTSISEPTDASVTSDQKQDEADGPDSSITDEGEISKPDYTPWIAAAGIILLLVMLGFWIFSYQGDTSDNQPQTMASTSVQDEPEEPEEATSADETQEESQSATATNQPNQTGQQNQSGSGTTASKNQQSKQPANHQINEGETLWSLAERQYDDPYLWPWIYDANQASVDNPDLIIAGNTLSMPQPDLPRNRLSTVDSLEVAIGYVSTYRWYKNHGDEEAKLYLWGAQTYDKEVFEHIKEPIDKDDLAFVNRVR